VVATLHAFLATTHGPEAVAQQVAAVHNPSPTLMQINSPSDLEFDNDRPGP
jgi:hypothetical protein